MRLITGVGRARVLIVTVQLSAHAGPFYARVLQGAPVPVVARQSVFDGHDRARVVHAAVGLAHRQVSEVIRSALLINVAPTLRKLDRGRDILLSVNERV